MYQYLLFLSLYLPFQLAISPAAGVDLASIRVLIVFLFFWWLAWGLMKKNIFIPNNPITASLLIFLSICSFSLLFARNIDWSLRKLTFLFSILPVYFVSASLIKDRFDRLEKIARYLVVGGVCVAVIGIFQFFIQFYWGAERTYKFWADHAAVPFLGKTFSQAVLANPSWMVNISGKDYLRAISVFPDPHMFSFYLGMTFALSWGIFYVSNGRKWLYLIFSLIILLADLLTFSRGGYLSLAALFLLNFLYFWKKMKNKFKIYGAIFIILVCASGYFIAPVKNRFTSIFNFQEGSNRGRLETWSQALEISRDNFFTGTGLGNYSLEIKPSADYREPIYAHNAYLDVMAETGIFGLLSWLSILLFSLVKFIRNSRREPLFFFLAASLVIFSVHSLVETSIFSPTVLALFAIIISFSAYGGISKNKMV